MYQHRILDSTGRVRTHVQREPVVPEAQDKPVSSSTSVEYELEPRTAQKHTRPTEREEPSTDGQRKVPPAKKAQDHLTHTLWSTLAPTESQGDKGKPRRTARDQKGAPRTPPRQAPPERNPGNCQVRQRGGAAVRRTHRTATKGHTENKESQQTDHIRTPKARS